MIKRWKMDIDCLYPNEDGEWIEYSDHLAVVKELLEIAEGLAYYLHPIHPRSHGMTKYNRLQEIRREYEQRD